jgi:asparagine synthase (glutamine-hydrolysing)
LAARDRFGKKPFYWARTASGLYWASEFRSLIHLVPEPLDEDLQGFYHYTTFNCYPRELTYFKQIHKLLPGHWLELSRTDSRPHINQYYTIRVQRTLDPPEVRRERIRELFEAAVRKRLMSDAPVGFFLSAGVDSTAIVSAASGMISPIMTFTVGVEGDPAHLSELPVAQEFADRCGAEIHAHRISEIELRDLLVDSAWALDEPVCIPSSALLNFLARRARDAGAKVMLSGEGSDEVFFGYPEYWDPLLRKYRAEVEPLNWIPSPVRDSIHEFLRRAPSDRLARLRARLTGRRFFTGNGLSQTDFGKISNLSLRVLRDPDVREWSDVLTRELLKTPARKQRLSPEELIMLNEFHIRLPDYLLMRVDKITMASSIETRCPFLDRDLVEYAAGLPFEDLYDGRFGKSILRQSTRDLVGDDIAWRPKIGFGGGSPNFVKPAVERMMTDVLEGATFLSDYYSAAYLDHLRRPRAEQRQFKDWNVVFFSLWKQRLKDHMATKTSIDEGEWVGTPPGQPEAC